MENLYSASTYYNQDPVRKSSINTSLKPCIYMLATIGICLVFSFIISILFNEIAVVPFYGIPFATFCGILIHKKTEYKEENNTEISSEEKKKQTIQMRYLLGSILICIFVYLIIAFQMGL